LKDQIRSFLDHFWNSKIALLLALLLHFCLFCGSKLGKKQKLLHFSVVASALVDVVVTMKLNCSFLGYGAVLIKFVLISAIGIAKDVHKLEKLNCFKIRGKLLVVKFWHFTYFSALDGNREY
jgi:hypothetical protein